MSAIPETNGHAPIHFKSALMRSDRKITAGRTHTRNRRLNESIVYTSEFNMSSQQQSRFESREFKDCTSSSVFKPSHRKNRDVTKYFCQIAASGNQVRRSCSGLCCVGLGCSCCGATVGEAMAGIQQMQRSRDGKGRGKSGSCPVALLSAMRICSLIDDVRMTGCLVARWGRRS